MGLSTRCFEILENRPSNYDLRPEGGAAEGISATYEPQITILSDDESEATEDEDEDDMEEAGGQGDETESEEEDVGGVSEDEEFDGEGGPKLRVREILFYEEKVEAFRRRHGVLRP